MPSGPVLFNKLKASSTLITSKLSLICFGHLHLFCAVSHVFCEFKIWHAYYVTFFLINTKLVNE